MSLIPQTPGSNEQFSLRPFHAYEDEALSPPPVLTELEAFLDKVICDGRYVHELDQPLQVAQKLGIDISPAVVEELKATPSETLLTRLYGARFRANGQIQMLSPDIGVLIIAAVVVTIVIVIAVVKWKGGHEKIVDRSPGRDDKL